MGRVLQNKQVQINRTESVQGGVSREGDGMN